VIIMRLISDDKSIYYNCDIEKKTRNRKAYKNTNTHAHTHTHNIHAHPHISNLSIHKSHMLALHTYSSTVYTYIHATCKLI